MSTIYHICSLYFLFISYHIADYQSHNESVLSNLVWLRKHLQISLSNTWNTYYITQWRVLLPSDVYLPCLQVFWYSNIGRVLKYITCGKWYNLSHIDIETTNSFQSILDLSENRCTTVPAYTHAIRSTLHTDNATVVSFACERGYYFDDNTTDNELLCLNGLLWVGNVAQCIGKYIIII